MAKQRRFQGTWVVAMALSLAVIAACDGGTSPTLRPFSFGPRPATAAPDTPEVEALMSTVAGARSRSGLLDDFWTDAVGSLVGSPNYRRPTEVLSYSPGHAINTECSGDESGTGWDQNAYYCPTDETVSWEREWFGEMYDNIGALAPVAVMAHEWGHHIQKLTKKPAVKLSSENQADCYSGAFFRHADDTGSFDAYVPEGDARDAVTAIYLLGNPDFDASKWYSNYGPPRSRQLAFGLGALALSPSACELYETFEYRPALQLGWYSLDPPASFTVAARGEVQVLTHDDVSAEVVALPDMTDASAVDQFETVATNWLGTGDFEWINDVYPNPFSGRLGGTSAIRTYEQRLSNADGTTRTIHGDIVLQADSGHGGILIDVYLPGPAPAGSLDGLTQWAAIIANGLCPGGEGTDLCPTAGGR